MIPSIYTCELTPSQHPCCRVSVGGVCIGIACVYKSAHKAARARCVNILGVLDVYIFYECV